MVRFPSCKLLLNVFFLSKARVELDHFSLQSQKLLLILVKGYLELIDVQFILAAHLLHVLVQRLDLFVLLQAHCLHLLCEAQQVCFICIVKLLILSLQLALFLGSLLLKTLKVRKIGPRPRLALLEQGLQLGRKLVLLLPESSVVTVLHVSYFVRLIACLLVKLIVPGLLCSLHLLLVLSGLPFKLVVP